MRFALPLLALPLLLGFIPAQDAAQPYRPLVKTAADPDIQKVPAKAQDTTIEWILGVRRPVDMPSSKAGDYAEKRAKPFETTLWTISGNLAEFWLDKSGDLVLKVSNADGKFVLAQVPEAKGVKSPYSRSIFGVRRRLVGLLKPTEKPQTTNMKIKLTGFGFFEREKGEDGVQTNGARLAPLIFADVSKPK